jgi:collagen triple helix repeat protein
VLTRLRRNLTYANVVASLALLLALAGGTAYAATQMLPKNSVGTRQLKNGAVTKAKIAPGVLGTAAGAPGPASAQGPAGPAGATGPAGAAGADGTPGADGNPGAPGASGTIADPLPSGQTEQGQFLAFADPGATPPASLTEYAEIDFPVPLASDQVAVYVPFGEPPSTECPGTLEKPAAAPGYICAYEAATINSSFTGFANLIDEAGSSRFGTTIAFKFENTIPGQPLHAGGTWAVTAP